MSLTVGGAAVVIIGGGLLGAVVANNNSAKTARDPPISSLSEFDRPSTALATNLPSPVPI